MKHEPYIRGVPAPTVFALESRTPLILNSRIATKKPAVQSLEDIVAIARLRGGMHALPPPEAALAAHILGLDHSGGPITNAMVKALVPNAWLDLYRRHPEVEGARVPRIERHDTPLSTIDGPEIVLFRDSQDWHGSPEVCVQFRGPLRLDITFPYSQDDCFVRHWIVAGALAAHFGLKPHRFDRFSENIEHSHHFAVPSATADTLLRLGAWLGLETPSAATSTDTPDRSTR